MKKNAEKINNGSRRKLSPWRVMIAVALVCGICWIAYYDLNRAKQKHVESLEPVYKSWFASYVDVTSIPTYGFEQTSPNESGDVVLSFIVSSQTDPCMPTWGSHFNLDEAAVGLDLDRRIARFQQKGGKIAISFGGAINSELALQCKDSDKLLSAYKSVVDRYNVNTIDLDLENSGLSDAEALQRRAEVMVKLQKEYRDNQKDLAIWLTLPVAPQGMTPEATDAIAKMLTSGVDLSGVNVMTMDYGASLESGRSMFDASKGALIETHRQLGIIYRQAGINLNNESIWKKIGATPMIGQNDSADEIFSIDDAKKINSFALSQGVGRMSMWSANRDIPCGENYVDVKVVSDSCSGVDASKSAFTQILKNGFDGNLTQNAGILTKADPESNTQVIDDPEKSPYQIWQENGTYPKGVKIVWHGNVYEAKWWTKNELPDNPVLQAWQTPWQLIGPVLPGEKPIQQPTLPKGTYSEWSGKEIYNGGDRVLFEGIPFQAKWWNQGDSPAASAANTDTSPWIQLSQTQIMDIIKELDQVKKKK